MLSERYNEIIKILRQDFNANISSTVLPLSARALYIIGDVDIHNLLIDNYFSYNTRSRQQISKLFRTINALQYSKKILSLINNENNWQARMMLFTSFEYFKAPEVVKDLLKLFWKEENASVKKAIFNSIAFQLEENGRQFYMDVLENEKHKDVLYYVFRTIGYFGGKPEIKACLNWLKTRSDLYDDFTINGALITLFNINRKYRKIFGELRFKHFLKKFNLEPIDSAGKDRYALCIYYSEPASRSPFFYRYHNETTYTNVYIFLRRFISQINKVIDLGIIQKILDNGLDKEEKREKFLQLIDFSFIVNNKLINQSSSNVIAISLPEKYSEYSKIDIFEQFNNLIELPKNEFICEDCNQIYIDNRNAGLKDNLFPQISLSLKLCRNHRFRELNLLAKELVQDIFIIQNFPIEKKISLFKSIYKINEIQYKPQTLWKNKIDVCNCGESNYPLTITDRCPICHMKSNLENISNRLFIDILKNSNDHVNYTGNFFYILNLYFSYTNNLKNFLNENLDLNNYHIKQFLYSEEQMILNWPIAKHVYQLILKYDQIKLKSEHEAVKLVSKILGDNNYIKYKKWSWLVSDTSGSPMHVDAFFPKSNIAVEYQGKQHFQPVNYFGGKEAFKLQIRRDRVKKALLKKHNIFLIEITKSELNWETISSKLKEVGYDTIKKPH